MSTSTNYTQDIGMLAQSTELFRALIEQSYDGVVLADKEGTFLYVSPKAASVLGYTPDDMIGLNAFAIIHEEDKKEIHGKLQELLAKPNGQSTAQFRLQTKEGKWRWMEGTGTNLLESREVKAIVVTYRDITDRKAMEEAIAESEMFHRTLVELVPDVIYSIGIDGKFKSLSPSFERITGWVTAEWVGKPFVDILHPQDVPYAIEQFQKGITGQQTSNFELRVRTKSGAYVVGEFRSVSQHDKDGNIIGKIGIARDITEQKQKQELLHIREEEFKALAEHSPDIVSRFDKDLRYVYVNQRIEEATGIPKEQFLGKKDEELGMPKDMVELWIKNTKDVFESGQEKSFEFSLSKDNKQRYFHARLVPERGQDGHITTVLGVSHDITELKMLEIQLKDEKDRLSTIINSMSEGILVTDKHFRIVISNLSAERLLECKKEDVVGKEIGSVVSLEKNGVLVEGEKRLFAQSFTTGKAITTQSSDNYSYTSPSGKKFPVILSVAPIFDSETTGVVNVFRDISELMELDKMKSEFISVAAHQLRTPLGLMRWHIETLLKEDQKEISVKSQETIKKIYADTRRVIVLVNDLLNVSRIDQGKMVNNPQPVYIQRIIDEVIADMSSLAKKVEVTIHQVLKLDTEKSLNIDPNRFRSVVQNILSNGIKYSHPGSDVRISVSSEKEFIKIQVADSGIGIPMEDKDKIFTKFFRASNAVLHETHGTGLGLYVVKLYVEDWGGEILINSEEGKGTTVTITIPEHQKEVRT